jgi:hypothetical protein
MVAIADALEVTIDSLTMAPKTTTTHPDLTLAVEQLRAHPPEVQRIAAGILRGYMGVLRDEG